MQMTRMMVTMAYMFTRSSTENGVETLKQGQTFKTNRGALLMGDIKALHTRWYTRTNNRGQQLVNWPTENSWTVPRPVEHTYRVRIRTSLPDTMLLKGTKQHRIFAREQYLDSGSNHTQLDTTVQRTVNVRREAAKYLSNAESIRHE